MKVKGSYENWLIVMAFAATGCVFIDRFAVQYLAPLFVKDLKLTQIEVGTVIGVLSVGWGISGWVFGSISDQRGRRAVILPAVVLFSLLSAVTGLVQSLVQMIVARLVMGAAEGAALTPVYAVVSEESTNERRGFNLGVMQSSIALIGGVITPIAVTIIGSTLGWRWGFVLAGLPGLLVAAVLWRYLREPTTRKEAKPDERVSVFAVFRYRNVWLSVVAGFLFGAYVACFYAFLPLFLTGPAYNLPLPTMGAILGGFGLMSFLSTVGAPFLSDRVGRKPVLILTSLAIAGTAFVPPLGLALPLMIAALIACNIGGGAIPIVLAIIPTETVPRTIAATAVAVPVFAFEIFGSFVSPIVAGGVADALHNPAVPLWIAGGAAFLVAIVSLFYRETAPAKLAAAQKAVALPQAIRS